MLYLICGTNSDAKKIQYEKLIRGFEKTGDSSIIRMDSISFDRDTIFEYIGSVGLFENRYSIVCNNILKDATIFATLAPFLTKLRESDNTFIFLEDKVLKSTLTDFKESNAQVILCDEVKEKKDLRFNIFAMADAFGARNKKRTWVLLEQALDSNVAPEEIHGVLFWQVKSMLIAKNISSPAESGLNPFVFKKALSFNKNFTLTELQNISRDLVTLYHEAHRGTKDMEVGLEQFILESL